MQSICGVSADAGDAIHGAGSFEMKQILIRGVLASFFALAIPLAILLGFKFFAPARHVRIISIDSHAIGHGSTTCDWSWPQGEEPFAMGPYYWWPRPENQPCRFDQDATLWKDLRHYYVMWGKGI